MPQPRVNCRYCGKEMSIGTRYNHEHKYCPKRPGAPPEGYAPASSVPQEDAKPPKAIQVAFHPRKALRTRTRKAVEALAKTVGDGLGNGHCSTCPFSGNAAEQDLFAQLVRDGLGIGAARERLGQARACFNR